MSSLVPYRPTTFANAAGSSTDAQLVELWLRGFESPHTQKAYRRDVNRFVAFTGGKPLATITLSDLQDFSRSLVEEGLGTTTRGRIMSSIKSLLSHGHRLGVLPFDVGRAFRLPKRPRNLAERILPEDEVQRIIEGEADPRNHALLSLLYVGGLRVSEVCGLRWRNLQPRRGGGGQVTVFGKGGKERVVLLPADLFQEIGALRNNADREAPIFQSAKTGSHLTTSAVWRIVRGAAERAGVEAAVSPHWFRHAHVSHALDRGAPIHLVGATVGHASPETTGLYAHARPGDSSSLYLQRRR